MTATNFASLMPVAKRVWERKVMEESRDKDPLASLTGPDSAVIKRITSLTPSERGEVVTFPMAAELMSNGTVGDVEHEGNEQAIDVYNDSVTIDILGEQVRNTGIFNDQQSVVKFRETALRTLSNWHSRIKAELKIQTLSGVAYTLDTNGATRTNSNLHNLNYASDVSAPTTNRHFRWDATNGLVAGDTTAVAAVDKLTYEACVAAKVKAETTYMPALMNGGEEYYVLMVRPEALQQLKQDADFLAAIDQAAPRSMDNPFFTGAIVTVDGLVFKKSRLVYNTSGATSGSGKWGAGSAIDGTRSLLLGNQALTEIEMGSPRWVEKMFQFDTYTGIRVDQMNGLKKTVFYNSWTGTTEDFAVLCLDHAL